MNNYITERKAPGKAKCSTESCNNDKVLARGMCSSCYSAWHRSNRQVYIECAECHITFQQKMKKNKYCSVACSVSNATRISAKANKKPLQTRTCPRCKVEFKHNSRKYCSNDCQRPTSKQTVRNCELCGDPYSIKVNQSNRFCSQSHAVTGSKLTGPASFAWQTGDFSRFLNEVKRLSEIDPVTNCHNYNYRTEKGYPKMTIPGTTGRLHRLVIEASNDGVPLGSLRAHHKCANTSCVNPDHLQAVTEQQNSAEMNERHSYIQLLSDAADELRKFNPECNLIKTIETYIQPKNQP